MNNFSGNDFSEHTLKY